MKIWLGVQEQAIENLWSETGIFHSSWSTDKSWLFLKKMYLKLASQEKTSSVSTDANIREVFGILASSLI